jgi:hypothetical protein
MIYARCIIDTYIHTYIHVRSSLFCGGTDTDCEMKVGCGVHCISSSTILVGIMIRIGSCSVQARQVDSSFLSLVSLPSYPLAFWEGIKVSVLRICNNTIPMCPARCQGCFRNYVLSTCCWEEVEGLLFATFGWDGVAGLGCYTYFCTMMMVMVVTICGRVYLHEVCFWLYCLYAGSR